MKLLLKIFVFVLLSGVAFGQGDSTFTIRGRITTQFNGKPLPYSTIRLMGTTRGAYLDSLGNFTIKKVKPGEYKVKVTSIETGEFDTCIVIGNENLYSFNIFIPLPSCTKYNNEKAEYDIQVDSIQLLLIGSLAPIANNKNDYAFEKKYNLQYYDFGCVVPNLYCILYYNQRIFKHLDQKFGKSWRKKVRPDVIGFKEYIKEN